MKKTGAELRRHLGINAFVRLLLENSRNVKFIPEKHLFTQKLQNTAQIGLSILNPSFSEIGFSVENWANKS
jgi:hypothetical protein